MGRLHVLPGRVNDFDDFFYQRSEMLQRCLMDYFGHNLQIFPSNIDVSMVCWPNLIKLKHICISEWCIFVSTGMIKDLIQIQMMYIWCARYLARVFLFAVGSNHSCFQDLCMWVSIRYRQIVTSRNTWHLDEKLEAGLAIMLGGKIG